MPESVVNSLPPPMTTGIYYGLSNVDGGEIFKTVLSIGWNPYYKNTKKSLVSSLQQFSSLNFEVLLIHQGSLLSLFLFTTILDVIQFHFRQISIY